MNISVPYYEDLSRISNSNIGWFLKKGPAYLHKMLTDPPKEEKNSVLERGTMIHEYLLQPEEFQKDYIMWDKRRPSSAQQEKFCRALASSLEIEPNRAILDAYKCSYSIVGKTDEKMLTEGLKIASELKDYIRQLKDNPDQKMISSFDQFMLEKIEKSAFSHKAFVKLFKELPQKMEVYHEFHINWKANTKYGKINCKSLLDYVAFDFTNHVCIIADLKTSQNIWTFEDSIHKYDYLRQLMYYTMAAKWYIDVWRVEDSKEFPSDKWTFEYYFIPIDTTGTYEVRVVRIPVKFVNEKLPTIQLCLELISWHMASDNWEHSKEYYANDGTEILSL